MQMNDNLCMLIQNKARLSLSREYTMSKSFDTSQTSPTSTSSVWRRRPASLHGLKGGAVPNPKPLSPTDSRWHSPACKKPSGSPPLGIADQSQSKLSVPTTAAGVVDAEHARRMKQMHMRRWNKEQMNEQRHSTLVLMQNSGQLRVTLGRERRLRCDHCGQVKSTSVYCPACRRSQPFY